MSARVWPQPLLVVRDVARSRAFYGAVLGAESGHGGDEYEQIVDGGEILLQLHGLDVEDHHGPLADPNAPLGNGVLLWFEVADLAVLRHVPQEPAHDLPGARLRQLLDDHDLARLRDGADLLRDVRAQLLDQLLTFTDLVSLVDRVGA